MQFIDCSHAVRGRRVFDVATAVYYMDLSSQAPQGDLKRYEKVDAELESAFLTSYRSACEPKWRDEETEADALEYRLMLVHGAVYWTTVYSETDVIQELVAFQRLRETLANSSRFSR